MDGETVTIEEIHASLRRKAADQPLILSARAPMALHLGPDHRIHMANAALMRMRGHRDVTGMLPNEALPDFVGQGIFEHFDHVYRTGEAWSAVRLDTKLTRRQEGTGLGLAISGDLALGMGGDLTAESEIGVGSCVTLSLVPGTLTPPR